MTVLQARPFALCCRIVLCSEHSSFDSSLVDKSAQRPGGHIRGGCFGEMSRHDPVRGRACRAASLVPRSPLVLFAARTNHTPLSFRGGRRLAARTPSIRSHFGVSGVKLWNQCRASRKRRLRRNQIILPASFRPISATMNNLLAVQKCKRSGECLSVGYRRALYLKSKLPRKTGG